MEPITCKPLTIFEGPDGGGKTTAALEYAKMQGARYVHFPALPNVHRGLARMYVEAMLPALLGYQPVVFDRCWLSEVPYGNAFREGQDRLGDPTRRMLERLAMRCGGVVVRCLPPWGMVKSTFQRRRELELLNDETQLRQVYDAYTNLHSELEVIDYCFLHDNLARTVELDKRGQFHGLNSNTVGNLDAPIVLVGEALGERKEHDSWYQAPFMSFSELGCSQWLSQQLHDAGIRERHLCWVNQDDPFLKTLVNDLVPGRKAVIALGKEAYVALAGINCSKTTLVVEHPQHWKRFCSGKRYPLLDMITEVINDTF